MKLSEELRIRGAAVGDIFVYTTEAWVGMEVIPSTYRVYNSSVLEDLLLGLYDEDQNFLWLVDKNGNKKEITKEAIEGDGMGCIIGVCNALAFTGVVVVVVCLLLGLLGN